MNKLIVFLLLSIVLYSQEANNNEENIINTLRTNKAYLNERDKLTSKLNIFTSIFSAISIQIYNPIIGNSYNLLV